MPRDATVDIMEGMEFTRRAAILGAAALPIIRQAAAQTRPTVVISSANRNNGGVNCCAKAMEIIRGGGDTLDAVIAGVNIVEAGPARQQRRLRRAAQRRRRGGVGRMLHARAIAARGLGGGAAQHQDAIQGGARGDGADRSHDAGGRGRAALRQGHGFPGRQSCSPRNRASSGSCGRIPARRERA